VKVFAQEQTDSASLGAAYRALHGWLCVKSKKFVPFKDVLKRKKGNGPKLVAVPDKIAHKVYGELLKRYGKLEGKVLKADGKGKKGKK
jgi:hypothetical protein